jgi:hypothetical protein
MEVHVSYLGNKVLQPGISYLALNEDRGSHTPTTTLNLQQIPPSSPTSNNTTSCPYGTGSDIFIAFMQGSS